MEEEEYFLYIIYFTNEETRVVYDDRYEITVDPQIKRCCIQRGRAEYDRHKRIRVDFDPSQKDMAFIVYILVERIEKSSLYKKFPVFTEIFDNLEEANIFAKSIEKSFVDYLEPKDKFIDIKVLPLLITKK